MNEAALERSSDGVWRLQGRLDFTSVPRLWPTLEERLRQGGSLELSLEGVTTTNSAALVMLVEALDVARRNRCRLAISGLPEALVDLARISRCDRLIGEVAA